MTPATFGEPFASTLGAYLLSKGWSRSARHGTKVAEFWTQPSTRGRLRKVWVQAAKLPKYVKVRLYFETAGDRDVVATAVRGVLPGLDLVSVGTSDQDPRCNFALDLKLDPQLSKNASWHSPTALAAQFQHVLQIAQAA